MLIIIQILFLFLVSTDLGQNILSFATTSRAMCIYNVICYICANTGNSFHITYCIIMTLMHKYELPLVFQIKRRDLLFEMLGAVYMYKISLTDALVFINKRCQAHLIGFADSMQMVHI